VEIVDKMIIVWNGSEEEVARTKYSELISRYKGCPAEMLKKKARDFMGSKNGLIGEVTVYVGECEESVRRFHGPGVFLFSKTPHNLEEFLVSFVCTLTLLPTFLDRFAFLIHSCKGLWFINKDFAKKFAKIFGFSECNKTVRVNLIDLDDVAM
jgi:hypothetical protein